MTAARILIIDDDPTIVSLLQIALEKAGLDVIVAEDGDAGLRLFREQMPDLAVVDIAMPGIDGYDVIRQIRAMNGPSAQVPVIVFTAHTMMRAYTEDLDIDLFLTKPVVPQELIRHIQQLLDLTIE